METEKRICIASSLLFSTVLPPSKDEHDTNCRNELLFKSLIMLRFSTPTRPFTAVQEFLFIITSIRSFLKNHNRFFPPHFTLNPSPSSTVFKSGNISKNPMHSVFQKICAFLFGLNFTSIRLEIPLDLLSYYSKSTYEIIVLQMYNLFQYLLFFIHAMYLI